MMKPAQKSFHEAWKISTLWMGENHELPQRAKVKFNTLQNLNKRRKKFGKKNQNIKPYKFRKHRKKKKKKKKRP